MNEAFIRRAATLAKDYPILYVDDEQPNLVVFRAELGEEFEILLAGGPEQGLELLQREQVAILLADQRMPVMTGVELCEQVRQRYPHVLRILVTAYSDQRTAIDAINRGGVIRYLVKPWSLEEVRQVLREAVARAHLEQTVRQLRAAILESERVAAVAATHARLLHDVGNLVTAVSNTANALERQVEQLRSGGAPGLVEAIGEEVADLNTATTMIRELYRSASRRLVPRAGTRAPLMVADAAGLVTQLLQTGTAGAPRVRVDCPDDLTAWADLTDVSRILMNLVTNARQALEGQGRGDGRIEIVGRPLDDGRVSVEVRDNGPGVPEAVRERIFELAYSGREADGGTGLGLAICRDLARANDGEIELVEGTGAPGAVFRLTLPAGDPEQRE